MLLLRKESRLEYTFLDSHLVFIDPTSLRCLPLLKPAIENEESPDNIFVSVVSLRRRNYVIRTFDSLSTTSKTRIIWIRFQSFPHL